MEAAYNTVRSWAAGSLTNFFSCQQRSCRSPGFEVVPNLASSISALLAVDLEAYKGESSPVNDQTALIRKIVFPIFLSFAAGFVTCTSYDYAVTPWLQDFAIDAVTLAIFTEVANRTELNDYKKGLYFDILFTVQMCTRFAVDKNRNPTLPFAAHSVHAIFSTLARRIIIPYADQKEWNMKEKHLRDATIAKVIFIALIFPIEKLVETKLQYSKKILALDFGVRTFATYALFSPSSPLVERMTSD